MKTKLHLQYYLDSCTVQALGKRLLTIPTTYVYSSIWTQVELLCAIKDEKTFNQKRAALKNLADSGIFVIQTIPCLKLWQAFGITEIEPRDYKIFREHILPIVINANDYTEFCDKIKSPVIDKAFKSLQEADNSSSSFGNYILRNQYAIIDFDSKWHGNYHTLLLESVNYHAERLENRFGIPQSILIKEYDNSIDAFMLVHYYYVEQKKHMHKTPARNDFNDILHLLYLKRGCKLVTDDKDFQDYVNEVFPGLAIGTIDFLKEIDCL